MALPLVFGAESDITTIVAEGADEFTLSRFRALCTRAGRLSGTRLHNAARHRVGATNRLKGVFPGSRFDDAIRWAAAQ